MGKAETASLKKPFLALRTEESRDGGTRAVYFLALLAIVLIFAAAAEACGHERWAVKTLADARGRAVSRLKPIAASIHELASMPNPDRKVLLAAATKRFPQERHTYQVAANVVGFKAEADGDFHIVLAEIGDPKTTMVAEIPQGSCVPAELAEQFDALQAKFAAAFSKPTAKFKKLAKPAPVMISGVGFFDFLHGQTGAAKNGFELHPVTAFTVQERR